MSFAAAICSMISSGMRGMRAEHPLRAATRKTKFAARRIFRPGVLLLPHVFGLEDAFVLYFHLELEALIFPKVEMVELGRHEDRKHGITIHPDGKHPAPLLVAE